MKMAPCPFCGTKPKGAWRKVRFCSSIHGPSVICDHCQAEGPPPYTKEMTGLEKKPDYEAAMKAWNRRFTE